MAPLARAFGLLGPRGVARRRCGVAAAGGAGGSGAAGVVDAAPGRLGGAAALLRRLRRFRSTPHCRHRAPRRRAGRVEPERRHVPLVGGDLGVASLWLLVQLLARRQVRTHRVVRTVCQSVQSHVHLTPDGRTTYITALLLQAATSSERERSRMRPMMRCELKVVVKEVAVQVAVV